MERDRKTDALLGVAGWHVVRIWEHEDPDQAAVNVEIFLRDLRSAAKA